MNEFRLTPETLAIIRNRIALGDEDWEIAGRTGCDLTTLHNICSRHGYELKSTRRTIVTPLTALDEPTRTAFAREAALRNMTPQRLMTQVLELTAKDRLFGAMLD